MLQLKLHDAEHLDPEDDDDYEIMQMEDFLTLEDLIIQYRSFLVESNRMSESRNQNQINGD